MKHRLLDLKFKDMTSCGVTSIAVLNAQYQCSLSTVVCDCKKRGSTTTIMNLTKFSFLLVALTLGTPGHTLSEVRTMKYTCNKSPVTVCLTY